MLFNGDLFITLQLTQFGVLTTRFQLMAHNFTIHEMQKVNTSKAITNFHLALEFMIPVRQDTLSCDYFIEVNYGAEEPLPHSWYALLVSSTQRLRVRRIIS